MNPEKKRSPFVISFTMFLAVGAVSTLVAQALLGPTGLRGAGLGVGVAALMCGVSHGLLIYGRRLKGNGVLMAMLGGALASLVILAVAMVVLGKVEKSYLAPASLTALAVYLAFRFAEGALEHRAALRAQPLAGGRTE